MNCTGSLINAIVSIAITVIIPKQPTPNIFIFIAEPLVELSFDRKRKILRFRYFSNSGDTILIVVLELLLAM